MDLHTGAVPGDESVPDGRIGRCMEATLVRGRRGVCQSLISDGQEDGRNQSGFLYSDRRSTAQGGSSQVPAEGVGRGGMGVAVTEQQDENQEGRGRGMGGGRTSKHLRRPTRVTAADAFPNAKRRQDAEVTKPGVPRRDHIIQTESYFAKGLERSGPP